MDYDDLQELLRLATQDALEEGDFDEEQIERFSYLVLVNYVKEY